MSLSKGSIFNKLSLVFQKAYLKLFIYNFITVFCGVFLACLIYELTYVENSFYSKKLSIDEDEYISTLYKDISSLDSDFQASILDDFKLVRSVVSLIKEYYVDKDTLNNLDLILSTVEGISLSYSGVNAFYSYSQDFKHQRIFNLEEIYEQKKFPLYLKISDTSREIIYTIDQNITDSRLSSYLLRLILFIKQSSNSYLSSVETSSLVLNSMLGSLDPHSSLLSAEAYEELRGSTEGRFGGIGLTVGMDKYMCVILEVVKGSPAEKSNKIFAGDKIVRVNGAYTFGMNLDTIGERMRGPVGESIELDILSSKDGIIRRVELSRADIDRSSVSSKKVTDKHNIIYVRIDSFCQTTKSDLIKELTEFKKRYGSIEGMILDLRGNPGGLLDQAIEVSDVFLSQGVIVSTKGELEEVNNAVTPQDIKKHSSIFKKKIDKDFSHSNYPIMLLVDQNSASASEIVAGALQDNRRALVIGQPTFGKGSVQSLIHLDSKVNPVIKLTISRYYTPSGKTIQNTGITPDVWLQPVYKKQENINLLGNQRFDNENFHKNRLNATSLVEDNLFFSSSLKGYYLEAKELKKILDDNQGEGYEFQIATDILTKVLDTYTSQDLKAMSRPYHWLGLSKDVSRKILENTEEVESWIEKTFDLSWTDDRMKSKLINDTAIQKADKKVNISVDKKLVSFKGSSLVIPVTIENNTNQILDRLSLFVVSVNGDMESKEILLEKLKPFQKIKSSVKVDIPLYPQLEGSVPIFVGISQDSQVVLNSIIKTSITLDPVDISTISYKFIKEVSKLNNEISFKMKVENLGEADINSMKVDLVNLTGSSVSLSKDYYDIKIKKLSSRESQIVIQLNNKDIADIDIGMNIHSSSLDQEISKVIRLSKINGTNDYSIDVL